MATHQSISGISDTEFVERMVDSHDERHDHAFRSYFDTHVSSNLPAGPPLWTLAAAQDCFSAISAGVSPAPPCTDMTSRRP